MSYLPLLESLRGRPVMLEVGGANRPSLSVVRGFLWDVFFDKTIALVIVLNVRDEDKQDEAGNPVLIDGARVRQQFYEYSFKWVRVADILSVESDANLKINVKARELIRVKPFPLYTDGLEGWTVLNNALSNLIVKELESRRITGEFQGIFMLDEKASTNEKMQSTTDEPVKSAE